MGKYKTAALGGSEVSVAVTGINCDIRNDSANTIYASAKPNIKAGADGVLAIPAGQAAKLLASNGRVYLLGSGSVQLCGNDYEEAVFKSALGGGGGSGVDQTARNAVTALSETVADNTDAIAAINNGESGILKQSMDYTDAALSELEAFVGYTAGDIYGVEADFVNGTFTRLAGAVGKSAGADFDGVNAFGGRRRCNLTDDGAVTAYYGDAAFTASGALTQAVTVGGKTYPVGTAVQVMVEQPKFYYRVVPVFVEKKAEGALTRRVRYYVSDTPKAGFKLHPAFIENGRENDKIYLSAFENTLWDASAAAYIENDAQTADFSADKLSSIGGALPASGLSQQLTRANARKLAHNRGNGWELSYAATICATELLMLIEYAAFNMQTAIGSGNVSKTDDGSTNMCELTGATLSLGSASGTANSGNVQVVSYRGEENLWGDQWSYIDGVNNYVDTATGEFSVYIADNAFSDENGSAYSRVPISPVQKTGYISAFCYCEEYDWLFIGGETSGNSALPVGDYFYQSSSSGSKVAVFGGKWYYGSFAGAFCWNMSSSTASYDRSIGGRTVFVPSKKET